MKLSKQTRIHDFFKRLPDECQFLRPSRSLSLRQTKITDFFGRSAENRRRQQKRKDYKHRYNTSIGHFRKAYAQKNSNDIFLKSRKGLCYYRTDFYHYFVIDPIKRRAVAELELDDEYVLQHVHVSENYRRQGIGLWLVKLANQATEGRLLVCSNISYNSRYRLTTEGAALISACQAKKIILPEQVFDEPMQSPDYGYN